MTTIKTRIQFFQRGGDKNHSAMDNAARWAIGQLMSTRLANTLTIKVKFRATGLDDSTMGCVSPDQLSGSKAPREFTIIIQRDVGYRQQLSTLFHELTHIQQLASSRLQMRQWKSDGQLHFRWERQELGTPSQNPYYTRPWEVEARSKQKQLMARWFTC